MARLESVGEIKTVRVVSHFVAGQLESIAPGLASESFGLANERRARALSTLIGTNEDRLQLSTASTSVMKVLKDQQLADPDYFAAHFSDQDLVTLLARGSSGARVGRDVEGLFALGALRTVDDGRDGRGNVTVFERANDHGVS